MRHRSARANKIVKFEIMSEPVSGGPKGFGRLFRMCKVVPMTMIAEIVEMQKAMLYWTIKHIFDLGFCVLLQGRLLFKQHKSYIKKKKQGIKARERERCHVNSGLGSCGWYKPDFNEVNNG